MAGGWWSGREVNWRWQEAGRVIAGWTGVGRRLGDCIFQISHLKPASCYLNTSLYIYTKSTLDEHKLLGTKLLGTKLLGTNTKLSISLHLYNQKQSATTKAIVHKYNDARSEVAAKRVNLTDHVRARFYNVDFLSRGLIFKFMWSARAFFKNYQF